MASAFMLCFGANNNPIRQTQFGKIRGKVTSRLPGTEVEEYLGIPFIAPPIAQLRFKRPTNPFPWNDVKETTSLPPACPQTDWGYLHSYLPTFTKASEDCLYMNIFVPRVKEKPLSVLLFIHGGGNQVGMGAMFDVDILAAYGNIVVISFNYRLGVLGFYADRCEGIEGNLGLLDQVEAMKWVQHNIKFFDGDPSRVTIYGHSAGAADVGLHLISHLTQGLFKNAVVHSGSPLAYWAVSECVPTSRKMTTPSNCKEGSSHIVHTFTYTELMQKSAMDKDFLSTDGEKTPFVLVDFRPVIDNYFLTGSPQQLLKCKKVHADSVLIVMAKDEGFPEYDENYSKEMERHDKTFRKDILQLFLQLLPGDVHGNFTIEVQDMYETWKKSNISRFPHNIQLVSDVIFFVPMIKLADLISKWKDDVYLLSFDYVSQNLTGPKWQGVPHSWDLFYVFGIPLVGHPLHTYTERDIDVAKTTMSLFSNFVKYGYLGVDGGDRLRNYNITDNYFNALDFHRGKPIITSELHFRKERVDFWYKYLFPSDDFNCSNGNTLRHNFTCSNGSTLRYSITFSNVINIDGLFAYFFISFLHHKEI